LAEERRAEVADRHVQVRVVKEVLHVDREGHVVAVLRRVAAAEALAPTASPAAASASPTSPTAAAATTTAAASGSAARVRQLAEADGLAQSKVDAEEAGALAEVARDDDLTGLRVEVERAEGRPAHAHAREVCCERRALREERVAVEVSTDGDVEGAARIGDDERVEAESPRQSVDRAAEEETVSRVE